MNFDKIALLKKSVRLVVGMGVTRIVYGIIDSNTSRDTVTQKVTIGAASVAIGSTVAEAVGTHTDAKIDELVNTIRQQLNR